MGETLGRFQYHHSPPAFPLGGDSLALGAFATLRRGFRVCDLGTGAGLLLLLLANREADLSLTGVELQLDSARQAESNMAENQLEATILQEDFRKTTLPAGQFDLVISNPPYFPLGAGKVKDGTRSEVDGALDELCQAAARLLKNGGRFALVHRPERLVDVFFALRGVGIEPKRMQCIAHSPHHPPSAVLVEGVRQGRAGLSIEVPSTEGRGRLG